MASKRLNIARDSRQRAGLLRKTTFFSRTPFATTTLGQNMGSGFQPSQTFRHKCFFPGHDSEPMIHPIACHTLEGSDCCCIKFLALTENLQAKKHCKETKKNLFIKASITPPDKPPRVVDPTFITINCTCIGDQP